MTLVPADLLSRPPRCQCVNVTTTLVCDCETEYARSMPMVDSMSTFPHPTHTLSVRSHPR